MEGSENLRQRGNRRKPEPEPELLAQLDNRFTLLGGEQANTMAAGSSRIIRYVLFAFFVSHATAYPLVRLTFPPGHDDSLLYIVFVHT